MEIKVLGCYGGQLPGKRLTSFLINNEVLVDAGGVTGGLGIDDQNKVKHILVSHAHLDHIKDIPMLADNVIGLKPDPIEVIAAPPVIDTLKSHVLNNAVWPDFTVIPSADAPVLAYRAEEPETTFNVGKLKVELVEVNHPVPTCGMFISDGDKTLLYTADTGPTERIWEKAKTYDNLAAIIVEVSFPDRLAELSLLSGHLSPCHLKPELDKLGKSDIPTYLYHFKPAFEADLNDEIKALGLDHVRPLVQDEVISV